VRWARAKGRIAHPFRDAYVVGADEPDLVDLTRAALLLMPTRAVIAGHTAAALYGFGVVRTNAIHVAVPVGVPVPRRQGIVAHERAMPFDGVVEVFGLPCLPPERCAVELARCLPRPDGLAILDAALHCGVCTAESLAEEVDRHRRLRGVHQARELVPLATPLAECRQETHLRLVLHDGRLPTPRPQLEIADEWGVVRYRTDLGYDAQLVGVEYDGSSHAGLGRMRDDRQRHNWLDDHGWRMRYVTDVDLYRRPGMVVDTVRTALNARRSSHSVRVRTPRRRENW
jgi:very-short-patch-repair endonuclease